jgi:pimeloyl-ACP methyl ester carboxylesterase
MIVASVPLQTVSSNTQRNRGETHGNGRKLVGSWVTWLYREAEPLNPTDRPPVILLHGLVSQGYSWRDVLPVLAEQGFRAIAPDWLGCGYSSKPDRRDFAYTPAAFMNALEEFVKTLGIEKFSLVAQGFLGSAFSTPFIILSKSIA